MSVDDWDKMEVSGAGAIFNVTYTYDPVGNRLLMEDSAAPTTYTYNSANELLTAENSPGVTTYTYDADGNRLTKDHPADGMSTYAWDTQNRLLSVHDPVAGRFTFAYNAGGQRVQRQTPDEQRKFVYDARKLLLETTAADATTLTYDYSGRYAYGELIGRQAHDNETSFHQYDALGSTDAVLDDSQAVTNQYTYRAFGKIESQSGETDHRHLFVGKFGYFSEEDLGLYFLNARYYDLATGQFIGRDRIGFDAGDTNLYRYVKNAPIILLDPTGESWKHIKDNVYQAQTQEHLENLAKERTGDIRDWVCIKICPSGRNNWTDWKMYPYALKGASADVSNLFSFGGPKVKMISSAVKNRKDSLLTATERLFLSDTAYGSTKYWNSPPHAGERLKNISGQGKTPIDTLVVGGHFWGEYVIGGVQADAFGVADLLHAADEKSFDYNTPESARKGIGPPPCWFRRGAIVYGLSCLSAGAGRPSADGGWAGSWAQGVLRPGSIAWGTTSYTAAFWNQNRSDGFFFASAVLGDLDDVNFFFDRHALSPRYRRLHEVLRDLDNWRMFPVFLPGVGVLQ